MSALTQPFKFPTKLWLGLSVACFVYLFFAQVTDLKDNLTIWRALLRGDFGSLVWGIPWLVVALIAGALAATVLGLVAQLFSSRRSK